MFVVPLIERKRDGGALTPEQWSALVAAYTDGRVPLHDLLSDEPQVLCLAANGYQAFVMRTAERTVKDPSDKIELKCCPRCGRIARTPRARQCRFCRHDWHDERRARK